MSFVDGEASYEELGKVQFQYVPLAPLRAQVPDPPPPPAFERTGNPVVHTGYIERPLPELFELISNFDRRLEWNPGVEELQYEKDRVNRVGTHHRCIINGDLIDFVTITDDFGEGKRVYGERLPAPPLVADVACYYIMEPEGTGTRLRIEAHYHPKPFPRSLAAPLFRLAFGRRLPGVLDAIKEAAKSPSA